MAGAFSWGYPRWRLVPFLGLLLLESLAYRLVEELFLWSCLLGDLPINWLEITKLFTFFCYSVFHIRYVILP